MSTNGATIIIFKMCKEIPVSLNSDLILAIQIFLPRQENAYAKQTFLNFRQQNGNLFRPNDFSLLLFSFIV